MIKTILVVDDERGIRLLLRTILEQEGFQIITANTGLEALSKVGEYVFDLIILDYQLPILNGDGVVRELKKRHLSIPLIVMSGLLEQIDKNDEAYEMVRAWIAKPFNLDKILHHVRLVLLKDEQAKL